MTYHRPVHILPLVNYNVYWPIIGHLHCMTSFFIRHYKLLPSPQLSQFFCIPSKRLWIETIFTSLGYQQIISSVSPAKYIQFDQLLSFKIKVGVGRDGGRGKKLDST